MTEIKLECGQTWVDADGIKRTVRLIEKYMVCYCSDDQFLDIDTYQNFLTKYAHKLAPKTVRKSQCLAKESGGAFVVSRAVYATREEADKYFHAVIQWPLVINGVEQWVEVPEQ